MIFQHGGHLAKDLYGSLPSVVNAGQDIYSAIAGCIGYWPLNDASGALTFLDYGPYAADGTPTNVIFEVYTAPDDSSPSPDYDGTAYGSVTDAGLLAVLPGTKGTMAVWGKVESAAWTDGQNRYLMRILVDGTHYILMTKPAAANQLAWYYRFGTSSFVAIGSVTTTQWFHMAMTWDTVADEMKAYFNGVQQVATQTSLPAQTTPVQDVRIADQQFKWDGSLADAALWNRVLSKSEIAGIYRNP